MNHDDDLERLLAGALHREAEQIEGAPGDYQRLQQRIATERSTARFGRRPAAWLPWIATAAAVATVIGVSGAWLAGRPDPTNTADPAVISTPQVQETALSLAPTAEVTRSSPSPSTSPTTVKPLVVAPTSAGALPVYWVAPGDRPGHVLYREWYTAPSVGAQEAVDAMLNGRPTDPDYSSPWRPAGARVAITDDAILVDVDRAAFADTSVRGELARVGVQQLVYTVTAAAELETRGSGQLPVRLLVDGEPGATVWGLTPMPELRRDPSAAANLWITSPVEGAKLKSGEITVELYGTAVEANVLWVVYRVDGGTETEVDGNFTMVGSMGSRAVGRFTVVLKEPGEYRIRAYEPDLSDGEAPSNPDVPDDQTGDDKTVVVS